ncbi:MAG: YfiR family protein [Candidatus Thiodiazotropha sp.]
MPWSIINQHGFRKSLSIGGKPQLYWFFQLSGLFSLLLLVSLASSAASEELRTTNPWRVEAAFLRNFAHYVTWPESAFSDDRSPWRICILGNDPFGELLENILKGRTEKGRSFTVHRSDKPSDLHHCQIVYMAYKVSMSRRAALAELKNLPVLTVSNAPGFLEEGGIIRFDVRDYVEMSINLDHAHAASLSVPTKMLEVSRKVIVDGKVRKTR